MVGAPERGLSWAPLDLTHGDVAAPLPRRQDGDPKTTRLRRKALDRPGRSWPVCIPKAQAGPPPCIFRSGGMSPLRSAVMTVGGGPPAGTPRCGTRSLWPRLRPGRGCPAASAGAARLCPVAVPQDAGPRRPGSGNAAARHRIRAQLSAGHKAPGLAVYHHAQPLLQRLPQARP